MVTKVRPTKRYVVSESGFVLASTLWVVAALLLLVAGFETYISDELQRSQQLRQRIQDSVDIVSTEQALRYLLSTHRQTLAGVDLQTRDLKSLRNQDGLITLSPVGGELRMDGRVYQGVGKVLFSIQDESGLIPVNSASTFAIESYLRKAGVPDQEVVKYKDRLKDYWDFDELRHLNGAEKNTYLKEGLSPPSNDYLRTHTELKKVLGWPDIFILKDQQQGGAFKQGQTRLFSSVRGAKINLNTMPLELLSIFSEESEAIIAQRDQAPFRSAADVKARLPALQGWPEEGFRFFPSSRIRLELWIEGSIQSQIIGLELSPFNLRGPLREHYRFSARAPSQPRLASGDSKTIFEQFSTLSSQ